MHLQPLVKLLHKALSHPSIESKLSFSRLWFHTGQLQHAHTWLYFRYFIVASHLMLRMSGTKNDNKEAWRGNETTIGWSLGNPALFKVSLQIAITCL
jgi:hypothetical protein